MLTFIIAVTGIGLLLVLSELLWRKKIIRGEYGRKIVHMIAGAFIASWPYFMDFRTIQLIAICAVLTLLVSRKFKVFHAIHDVKRRTYGELLYPISILLIASIANADWIFSVAVLFIALADGMAAIVGRKWGTKKYSYTIGSTNKTLIGTTAYILFAYVVLAIGLVIGGRDTLLGSPFLIFVWLPLFCSFLEAVSPYGTDNITAPAVVVLLLNILLLT